MRTKHPLLALLVLILGTSTIGATYLVIKNDMQYTSTSSPTPTVSVSPTNATMYSDIGKTFTVNITITNANDLYVWQAGMTFNATLLGVLSFKEGPFLEQENTTLWTNGTIDNIAGIIHYHACALAGNVTGVNGNGTLGTMIFKVKNYGNSTLQLTDVILLNSELTEIDKTLVHGSVKIKIPGDVNADGIVDVLDVSGISAHWYPGPPVGPLGYDQNFDINGDGSVDIVDLAKVSAYWTGPPKGPLAP